MLSNSRNIKPRPVVDQIDLSYNMYSCVAMAHSPTRRCVISGPRSDFLLNLICLYKNVMSSNCFLRWKVFWGHILEDKRRKRNNIVSLSSRSEGVSMKKDSAVEKARRKLEETQALLSKLSVCHFVELLISFHNFSSTVMFRPSGERDPPLLLYWRFLPFFLPWKGFFYFLGVFRDPMWGPGTGMSYVYRL